MHNKTLCLLYSFHKDRKIQNMVLKNSKNGIILRLYLKRVPKRMPVVL
nr:MAG TPA: hypothetical protein [Caudoviricetes sp.]